MSEPDYASRLERACAAGLSASDAKQYADGSARLMVEDEEDGSDEEQFLRETEKQFTEEKP